MQHDLGEPDQGSGKPRHLPVRRLAGVALVVLLAGCDGGGSQEGRSIVLVSGKDDHGLPAEHYVAIASKPDGSPVGEVHDGTLVHVLEEHGEWLRVRTVEGPAAEGWINDYYLRGTAHVVSIPPGCALAGLPANAQVELVAVSPNASRVRVRALADGAERWVPRANLLELPDRSPSPRRCS